MCSSDLNTYAFAKEQGKTRPRMKRYAGKDYGQPLILSGVMYEGVDFWRAGNVVNIGVKEPNGHSPKGFDYAGFWEDNAGYLEGGMNLVRDSEIDAILDRAITDIVGF